MLLKSDQKSDRLWVAILVTQKCLKYLEIHGKTGTTGTTGTVECMIGIDLNHIFLSLSIDCSSHQFWCFQLPMAFCLTLRSKFQGLNSSALVAPACWLAHGQIACLSFHVFPVACAGNSPR
jgi:hypothetical protein